ncbi:MAG: DEAD/DEAH box helicase family protein [Leptospirillia bacterium]
MSQEGFHSTDPLLREKLVRDGIAELPGRSPARRAGQKELRALLAAKVVEEASELAEQILFSPSGTTDGILLEMADLVEVLARVKKEFSLDDAKVEEARKEKSRLRGGFSCDRVLSVPAPVRRLSNGTCVPLGPSLLLELARCRRADLAVAFLKKGGVEALRPALREALGRGARIRILTTDYLDATDPEALEILHAIGADSGGEARGKGSAGTLDIRCHLWKPDGETSRGYHPKAYLFEREDGRRIAFAGSSNLSEPALGGSVEWNVFLRQLDLADPVDQLSREFEQIFSASRSVPVDEAFIASYRARRKALPERLALFDEDSGPRPTAIQEEALLSLALLREEGETKALAILATGMGKTYLAAFDSREFSRVLFLAHRREILEQARVSFMRVRPDARTSFVGEGEIDLSGPLVFAQVQTLARPRRLEEIPPDAFDYVVVDECHHADAPTYRRILSHFCPDFVLGLTATPYRTDNGDIFSLMDGNVACRRGFLEGIREGVLAPFRYFGLKDTVDYAQIPWRGNRYEMEALEKALSDSRRSAEVLRACREHEGSKTVAFCVSRLHARLMAEHFRMEGIAAASLDGEASTTERRETLAAFRAGEIAVLFVVDLLNEGVDIPEIDRVMLLRPTDSPTVFLQQIGRGLRRSPGKSHLTVLDFIGNHRRVHYVLPALAGRDIGDGDWASTARKVLKEYESGTLVLAPGVSLSFEWEAIEILKSRIARMEPRERLLLSDYEALWESVGHRPTLLDAALEGDRPVREYLRFFDSWHALHLALEREREEPVVSDAERHLFSEAGDFLREIERTNMSRSYKMAVLSVLLAKGGFLRPLPLSELVGGIREVYKNRRYRSDLLGTPIADLDHVTDRTLTAHLKTNPVNAWTGEGKKDKGSAPFFRYDRGKDLLVYEGKGAGMEGFEEAVRERVDYRLTDYFSRRKGISRAGESSPDPEG